MKYPTGKLYPFICSALFLVLSSVVYAHVESTDGHTHVDEEITESAQNLVKVYADRPYLNQQLLFGFDHPKRTEVDFLPLASHSDIGVTVGLMRNNHIEATHGLLRETLSDTGYLRIQSIMSLEGVLRHSVPNQYTMGRLPDAYQIQFFGDPRQDEPYAIKYEGHHISLNITVADDSVRGTPLFLGSNPAHVEVGTQRGFRALAPQEDLACELLASLSKKQSAVAVQTSDEYNIPRKEMNSIGAPRGLAAKDMTKGQQQLLLRLIQSYAKTMRAEIADEEMNRIESAGIENIHFLWSNVNDTGKRVYYRVQGPTVLIEFQKVADNHIHSLWRDPHTDFGKDLLVEHLKEGH
ncbi:MAG: DUF3500 domain-containing protein [Puniceicoccaceae bacterium]